MTEIKGLEQRERKKDDGGENEGALLSWRVEN